MSIEGNRTDEGSDERELLRQTADEIFAKACTPERIDSAAETGWDEQLWRTVEQAGFSTLSVEDGDLLDAATVVRSAAASSAMVPLAETILAGWLAGTAGVDRPDGPLTTSVGTSRVPYGRSASALLVVDGAVVLADAAAHRGTNLAREPRDEMTIDDAAPRVALEQAVISELGLRSALMKSVQLSGAAERALELTVQYVKEREAFGRSISQFQAVQQQVAQMAAEVALMRASADAAVLACQADGVMVARIPVAAAMAASAHSAGIVAKIAHQMHGAIGFTYEHALRHSTLRLWSWRDEVGGEACWASVVGEAVRGAGGDGLWSLIAGL